MYNSQDQSALYFNFSRKDPLRGSLEVSRNNSLNQKFSKILNANLNEASLAAVSRSFSGDTAGSKERNLAS